MCCGSHRSFSVLWLACNVREVSPQFTFTLISRQHFPALMVTYLCIKNIICQKSNQKSYLKKSKKYAQKKKYKNTKKKEIAMYTEKKITEEELLRNKIRDKKYSPGEFSWRTFFRRTFLPGSFFPGAFS